MNKREVLEKCLEEADNLTLDDYLVRMWKYRPNSINREGLDHWWFRVYDPERDFEYTQILYASAINKGVWMRNSFTFKNGRGEDFHTIRFFSNIPLDMRRVWDAPPRIETSKEAKDILDKIEEKDLANLHGLLYKYLPEAELIEIVAKGKKKNRLGVTVHGTYINNHVQYTMERILEQLIKESPALYQCFKK